MQAIFIYLLRGPPLLIRASPLPTLWPISFSARYGPLTVFEIYNFQTTMDGETIKTNILDLEKLNNYFIWIRLGFQLI